MIVVETRRLVLRRITADDAAFMLELLNQPSFLRFVGDKGVRTLDDARRYILEGPVASYARFGFGLFLTVLRDGQAPIGICGLLKRDTLDDVDLGFANLPQFCSQGYAHEAAYAVLEYGRRRCGLERIVAIVSPDNAASIALLEKLEMRYVRTLSLATQSPQVKLYASEPGLASPAG